MPATPGSTRATISAVCLTLDATWCSHTTAFSSGLMFQPAPAAALDQKAAIDDEDEDEDEDEDDDEDEDESNSSVCASRSAPRASNCARISAR